MSNHYWDFPIVTAVCGLAGGMRSWLSSVWCTYDADDALSVYVCVCVCVVWQVAWLIWVVSRLMCGAPVASDLLVTFCLTSCCHIRTKTHDSSLVIRITVTQLSLPHTNLILSSYSFHAAAASIWTERRPFI